MGLGDGEQETAMEPPGCLSTANHPASPASAAKERAAGWAVLLLNAVLVGLLVRLSFVVASGFPLNDGGLFYAMSEDLWRAGYALPLHTSCNSAGIPYAYPPLAFYLAALLRDVLAVNLLDVLRFAPLLLKTLAIGSFILLARSLLPARVAVLFAVYAFALFPSFQWEIMGGGLARSLGLLFAIVAVLGRSGGAIP